MKTAYEMAWTLLSDFYDPALCRKDTLGFQSLLKITGLDEQTLRTLENKLHLVRKIRQTQNGVDLARNIIEEIEQGKPHYPVCSLSGDNNNLLDLPVCIDDEELKKQIFNPLLLEILEKVVRAKHLQARVRTVLMIFVQEHSPQMTIRDLLQIPYSTFVRLPNCSNITTEKIMMFLDYFRIKQAAANE